MKNMKSLLLQTLTVLVAACHGFGQQLVANTYDAALTTHADTVNRTNDVAITTRHLLWTQGASAGTIKLATAVLTAIGSVNNVETGTGLNQTVLLLGKGKTKKMVASGAIPVGSPVFQDAAGKVSALGVIFVGTALSATAADGDLLEVADTLVATPAVIGTATAVAGAVLAIPVTHRTVNKTVAGAEALTLADGVFLGQKLKINTVAQSVGTGTLTPTTASGWISIALAEKGQSCDLEWTTAGWILCGFAYVTTKPLVAVA